MALRTELGFNHNLQPPGFSVLKALVISFVVIVFFSPKCTCVSDRMKVTAFKRSLKYSLHPPQMPPSLLSTTPFWSLNDLAGLQHYAFCLGDAG